MVKKSWPSNRNLSYLEKKNMDVFLVPKTQTTKSWLHCFWSNHLWGPQWGWTTWRNQCQAVLVLALRHKRNHKGEGFRVVTRVLWFHWLSAFWGLAFSLQQIPANLILEPWNRLRKTKHRRKARKDSPHQKRKLKSCSFYWEGHLKRVRNMKQRLWVCLLAII